MAATSIGRIVVPSLALVAACGAALAFGITHVWREPPAETRAAIVAQPVSPPASAARDEGSAAVATAQGEANALANGLAVSPPLPGTDESVPGFDIARIEQTGDAVIAGRAAPGAVVELLRNGEPHDRVVADQSGQFVMVPPRLPPGDYELTLRTRQPDGKQAISKQSVVVALAEVEPSSGAVARAEVPSNVPDAAVANRSVPDQAAGSPQAHRPSRPALQTAKGQDAAISQLRHASAAILPSDGSSPSTTVAPKMATTTVVSRGDSLWSISRLTYGEGMRYALVYKANRDRIRDPNRIYPGQTFILPMKGR